MHTRAVADDQCSNYHAQKGDQWPWCYLFPLENHVVLQSCNDRNSCEQSSSALQEVRIRQGNREERYVGPEIEDLCEMQCCNMVGLVAWLRQHMVGNKCDSRLTKDNASVQHDERNEGRHDDSIRDQTAQ